MFDDESPNWELVGKAFMTFLPSCLTVELLCGPEDVECWANLAVNGGVRISHHAHIFCRL